MIAASLTALEIKREVCVVGGIESYWVRSLMALVEYNERCSGFLFSVWLKRQMTKAGLGHTENQKLRA